MQEKVNDWLCRYAPSLGELEDTPESVWGTKEYNYPLWGYPTHTVSNPTVFFGLYGFPDFYKLWTHKARKAILWAGSDINHFINGYWLDDRGEIKMEPQRLAEWINKNCESYVENGVEHEALMVMGIESKIVPSFMGNVKDYEVSYEWSDRPKVYVSVSGDNFGMYGWDVIEQIADKCDVDFYLYGNTKEWVSKHHNVFVVGRVPKDVMNQQIKHMQCGLRLNDFDGFSEITAKSVLWGQHPITRIYNPYIDHFTSNDTLIALLQQLVNKKQPNIEAREYYLRNFNKYPWNSKND